MATDDIRIDSLIGQAQTYSNPTDQIPTPPTVTHPPPEVGSPDSADRQIDRAPRPPWFDPIDRPDVDHPQDEDFPEVPIVDGDAEIPDPPDKESSQIGTYGIDALAYYAPFHFYRRNRWGIYIRDYGIAYLASRFLGRKKLTRSDNWILRCAYWLLFEHEYFHFQTEIAATHYEVLTNDLKAYEHLFHDRYASWLEEGMANARAHRHLKDHEDVVLTFSRIDHFKGFASSWMKTQPPGYRDFDTWCKTSRAMDNGRAVLSARIHGISSLTRRQMSAVTSDVLRLYETADYSRIPVIRVHDSGIPWLKFARLFPKALGLQVFVYTREHPPVHIHVEFLNSDKSVRLAWPSLNPLPGEPALSAGEISNLKEYLRLHQNDILEKLKTVFQQSSLGRAV